MENVEVYLTSINSLFEQPTVSPLDEHPMYWSGIEYLIDKVPIQSSNRPLTVTFLLPAHEITPEVSQLLAAAVRNYCQAHLTHVSNMARSVKWEGLKALRYGLCWLAICLTLSVFFRGTESFPPFLRDVFGEGFLIAGWVGIWRPTESFLYEWWPSWRERHVFSKLLAARIEVQAHS